MNSQVTLENSINGRDYLTTIPSYFFEAGFPQFPEKALPLRWPENGPPPLITGGRCCQRP